MPTQYRLEVESLEVLKERVAREFGPDAKVVSAEWVSQGGLGKFMSKRFIEAIVELPDQEPAANPSPVLLRRAMKTVAAVRSAEAPGTRQPAALSRTGLEALLDQADAQEDLLATPSGARRKPAGDPVDFGRLLDGRSFDLEPATGTRAAGSGPTGAKPREARTQEARTQEVRTQEVLPREILPRDAGAGAELPRDSASVPVSTSVPVSASVTVSPIPPGETAPLGQREILPSPLEGPGDLVVVIGLWGDGVAAGAQLGEERAMRRQAGELAPKFDADPAPRRPILDRRGIMRARASAVEEGVPLVVCVALNPLQPLVGQLEVLDTLGADQLWVAVDAGRKSEDTAAWVNYISARHRVYALVSLHANETLSPESVLDLGFPVFDITAPMP